MTTIGEVITRYPELAPKALALFNRGNPMSMREVLDELGCSVQDGAALTLDLLYADLIRPHIVVSGPNCETRTYGSISDMPTVFPGTEYRIEVKDITVMYIRK